jgi:hypothetical protein
MMQIYRLVLWRNKHCLFWESFETRNSVGKVQLLDVLVGVTYSYHWALKG